MKSFIARTTDAEYLDKPDIPSSELYINLKELDFINNYLGGHTATIKGLEHFLKKYKKINTILDVGCGGGDTLGAIAKWCVRNNLKINLTGIDILPEAIDFAENNYSHLNIKFICYDYNTFNNEDKYDVVLNSLICHHFYREELLNFIKFHASVSNYGFIINDLHRHPIAYYSISLLTRLFSNSYMVKNDAPLSVKKGFKKSELEAILSEAGVTDYKITWEWAFRYLVIADNGKV